MTAGEAGAVPSATGEPAARGHGSRISVLGLDVDGPSSKGAPWEDRVLANPGGMVTLSAVCDCRPCSGSQRPIWLTTKTRIHCSESDDKSRPAGKRDYVLLIGRRL